MSLYSTLRPLLFSSSPEAAHGLAIKALASGLYPAQKLPAYPRLTQKCFGLVFENPIGLAAGFDKNAEVFEAILKQGFGFTEVGSITPRAQVGNDKPRMFRLPEHEAVINRLGFNNKGMDYAFEKLSKRDKRIAGIVGVNLGRNKTSPNTPEDYVVGFERLYNVSDYITVNISSPNTAGLREMQKGSELLDLLTALAEKRNELAVKRGVTIPILLKIAPDMQVDDAVYLAERSRENRFSGLIISNTTIERDAVKNSRYGQEMGGLSGKPLFAASTELLKEVYKATNGLLPIVGVGGVSSAADAYAKIRAGASLVQLYTALIYNGFSLVSEILEGLDELLARDGYSHISDAIGADCK